MVGSQFVTFLHCPTFGGPLFLRGYEISLGNLITLLVVVALWLDAGLEKNPANS